MVDKAIKPYYNDFMPYKNIEKRRQYYRDYHRANRERIIKRQRNYRVKLRLEVLSHYSNGELKCDCCGERQIEFLTIDHIKGDGAKHRKTIGATGGMKIYLWLRKQGYPKGYRVLCYNCNQSYGFYGYCPHKKGD